MVESFSPAVRSSSEDSDAIPAEPAAAAAIEEVKEGGGASTSEDPQDHTVAGGRRSILVHEGSHPAKKLESAHSVKLAMDEDNNNYYDHSTRTSTTVDTSIFNGNGRMHVEVPEPPKQDLPQFMDLTEKEKSIKLAKELAQKALAEDGDEAVQQTSFFGLNCCAASTAASSASLSPSASLADTEITEETFNRLSSRRVNSIVDKRLGKELAGGPTVIREESFQIHDAVVSFSSFISSKQSSGTAAGKETDRPVPLTSYLPPSPLFTFDGKLGVECMAFKLDFTDTLNNVVPPYFLAQEETFTPKQKETLKKGISFANAVDLFGQETVEALGKELPAPRKKSLVLL